MSPEQAEGRAAGPEADVYSLALTLYECWSGENPHRRASPAATARAIGARTRPLRRLRPDLPRELTDEIDACLAARPNHRPSLEELGTAIEDSLDLLADQTAPAPRPPRRPRSAPSPSPPPSAPGSPSATAPCSRDAAHLGFSDRRPTQPRVPDRRPRRGGLQPRLQLRGAAGRTRAQTGEGNGRPQDRLGRSASTCPNEYTVYLSEQDRAKLEGYERSLEQELSGYLLEHARRRSYDLLTRPAVEFDTDERLRLGEFGIQARLVKPPAHEGEAPKQGEEGHTMVYSAVRERDRGRPKRPEQAVGALVSTRAVVSLDDRRYVLDGPRATIGRSKSVECVLSDPNVSRRHAELRRAESGDWQIVDLGSTNGIKVNGRRVASTRLRPGDQVTVGTTTFLLRHRAVDEPAWP